METVFGKASERSVQNLLLAGIASGLADLWHCNIKTD